MKVKYVVILIVASLLCLSACAFQERVEEPETGKYVLQDAQTEDWAWVLLEDGNRFKFNRNLATSYLPMGTYSVEEDVLILKASEEETYRFRIEKDRLIFESGKYAESLLEIGAVFKLTKDR